MSLTKCPECGLQISDKAITCPHCGYPLEPEVVKRAYTKPTKRAHRKLPNGFGSITELHDGRFHREPFLVRVTVGKTDTGRPITRNLKPKAYFKTYNDAYTALLEYHRTPEDKAKVMTMEELYNRWSESYFEQVSESTKRSVVSCWKKSSDVYNTHVADLKAFQIRNIIDEEPSANMKQRIKWMFDLMLDYAVEYGYVDKNISKSFKLGKTILSSGVKEPHIALSREEIKRLWELVHEPFVDAILIGCYTGLRPNELLGLRNDDIDFEQWVIHTAGSKTASGKNRVIPVHEKIKPLLEKRRNISEWLFNTNGYQITYPTYKYQFTQILPSHRPHDTRKTFATYAAESKMDEIAIKRIMGHALDVTEGVYTERSIEWLRDEMSKLSM